MANWCSNTVQFEGTAKQLKQLEQLFEAMAALEEKEGCGQLPDFIHEKTGYFFSTRWEEDVLYYETKWSPNTDKLIEVANYFNVGFTQSYEESGMLIFGEAWYKDGSVTIIELDDDDFDSFSYDDQREDWVFEGEHYESDYEIKEILLERKK